MQRDAVAVLTRTSSRPFARDATREILRVRAHRPKQKSLLERVQHEAAADGEQRDGNDEGGE